MKLNTFNKMNPLPIHVQNDIVVSIRPIYYEPGNMLLKGTLIRTLLREMRWNKRNK